MNWTHSCRQAAELLSQRLDEPLGWLDTVRLRVHLAMCGNCRNVAQQLAGVDALAAELFANGLCGGDREAKTSPLVGSEDHPSQSDA